MKTLFDVINLVGLKTLVAANTGLKTLYWMAWWLGSRVGCQ